jgi:hypothetical protein
MQIEVFQILNIYEILKCCFNFHLKPRKLSLIGSKSLVQDVLQLGDLARDQWTEFLMGNI